MTNLVIIGTLIAIAIVLVLPAVAKSKGWRATTTPLASIIGSGFLVLGPILDDTYGALAPVVMAALCLVAYAFGAAIRVNIAARAGDKAPHRLVAPADTAASWALAFAYVISVAYYLNLLGSFAVNLTPFDSVIAARCVTTVVYLVILGTGWYRGFGALERLEQISVGTKLAIIGGLLAGLVIYFGDKAQAGDLIVRMPQTGLWAAVTLGFGLIVTVQGFETSRYLGNEYDPRLRIKSMRWAQWLSSAIYMVYIGLIAYVFRPNEMAFSETAIIDMMQVVAPVLPPLLVIAAISAQFSAAVADTSGSGGLLVELTGGRISAAVGYAILVGVGLGLTWAADVFQIIAWASRAFAFYYALQAAIAALNCRDRPARSAACWGLAALGIAIAILGRAIES